MAQHMQVIVLFDDVLPSSSAFSPRSPPLHSLPSVQALGEFTFQKELLKQLFISCAADAGRLSFNEARKFLIRYLVIFSYRFLFSLMHFCSLRKRYDQRH